MEKAYLILVDGQGAQLSKCLHPLYSSERLNKIARCQSESMRMEFACAELAYLVAQKTAFGEIRKDLYEYRENNKPYFKEEKYGCLSFAHTRNTGACLIAPAMCGCDIEEKSRDISKIESKIRFSEKREAADALTLWCVKESFVKFTGEGLSRPFSKIYYSDNTIQDECGKHLTNVRTGEIGHVLWAVSLEKAMEISVVFLTAEEAVMKVKNAV